jgi:hypothetical protein
MPRRPLPAPRLRVPFLCAALLAACAGPAEGEQRRDSLAVAGDTTPRRTLPPGPWDQCGRVGPLTAASAGWREAARIAREDSLRADSLRTDSLRADSLRASGGDSAAVAATGGRSTDGAGDTTAAGTGGGSRARGAPLRAASADRGRHLPDSLPDVVPGSLFPGCRVVSYYGNPLSRRMGILGELPPKEMMERLERQAAAYRRADSTTVVIPALELIAVVAQASAGRDSTYRARMADTLIKRVAAWAEEKGWLLILDVQVGHSDVKREVRWIMPYLTKANVHLALDPEFDMPNRTRRPGTIIGTTSADDINWTIDTLAKVVAEHDLPPKMLIVHRFTRNMITESERIRPHSSVQVVIDMDGFGPPRLKRDSYEHYIRRFPVQFAGFKLFYKNDKPIMTPEEVLQLDPIPFFIMYQ